MLDRKVIGTKLPSERLRLNASKSESRPEVMIIQCLPRKEANVLSGGSSIGCGLAIYLNSNQSMKIGWMFESYFMIYVLALNRLHTTYLTVGEA